ncbi:MAG TPA: GtrA family protein [Nitratifractor sp.]|jgi:putative flippase GtrA|nr:GtrA family protein [Nitratifractor sp.]HHH20713.1 GtrA family protein [Nitratifractor sp.]
MIRKIFDKTFLRFVGVGIINTLIGYATILFFFHIIGLNYSYSYFISYVIGIIISFFLNRRLVFFSNNNKVKEFIKFLIAFGISYIVSYIGLYLIVENRLIDTNYAFFAGMVIYSTLFYLLNRFVTFR